MSLQQCEDTPGDYKDIDTNEEQDSASGKEMDAMETETIPAEFHPARDTVEVSPRSQHTAVSSTEIFVSPARKGPRELPRPKFGRVPKMLPRPIPALSSIPLPVKSSGPLKIPSLWKNAKSASRTSSISCRTNDTLANKHTLEIQFINKNKRYVQLRKELLEKQRPILDLYQNLIYLKRRLEEFGKNVNLDEVKLISYDDYIKKPPPSNITGAGEQISMEVVTSMKNSIEEIPKTLMDICKNLLSRRALIVELLESVTKSEVDMVQVSDKIESLKSEGQQLQQSLDAVIHEHELKISQLMINWQKLLDDKQCSDADSKIEILENKLKNEERLRQESSIILHDLHKKMEDRKIAYDKSIAELNGVLQTLKDQIKKLEQDLENERKTSVDFKSRNNTNAQNLKTMRTKITELENEKKDVEHSNAELQKKIKQLQDQLKNKDLQWTREKDEMAKSLKHQENLLQKITADKNQFETRLENLEISKNVNEEGFQTTIESLQEQLLSTRNQLTDITAERNEAVGKCSGFESYIARMGAECKETMNKVSYSIEWGKAVREVSTSEAENYRQDVAKDLRIRELEDKIVEMERERQMYLGNTGESTVCLVTGRKQLDLNNQKDRISNYQLLLEESENKLRDKSTEVETLRAEIKQLRVRQESIEEQNDRCDPQTLQRMLDEGRKRLQQLMSRSLQSDAKLEKYEGMLEKQKIQIAEMDNLLRYRENMANVLKASRNELLLEKDSLAKYSREVRTALAEVSSQSKVKEDLIKSLQEKITLREGQIMKYEALNQELETKLQMTNEKRYKLQDTVALLERELQKAHAKMKEVASIHNQPASPWSFLDSVYEVVEDEPNKKVSHYSNSLMENEHDERHSAFNRKRLRDINNPASSHQSSSNKFSYQNLSTTLNSSSAHTQCYHKANSRSLISLSLQTVDFIKTRLNFLTSVDMDNAENHDTFVLKKVGSTQTTPNRNFNKLLELTAHRYEYLQNQAHESYDDLSSLVKLAVTQKSDMKK